jgi:septum formation protein
MPIVLASASKVRRALLEAAGLDILVDPAAVDEAAVKDSYAGEGAGPGEIAEALAELKARRISPRHPGLIVLGSCKSWTPRRGVSTSPRV